jgi:3-hydroxyacyl-CoA dehydrogenase
MPDPVRTEDRDGVRVVTLDNPPVNAFSHAQRSAVDRALAEGLADDGVKAFVIAGAGRIFSAGADILEFDGDASMRSPHLPELITRIENATKPVVVALHGTALGGACELALGCHGRVAAEGTRIGLPEVTLGIVPGAGGTQRLPRLIGVARRCPKRKHPSRRSIRRRARCWSRRHAPCRPIARSRDRRRSAPRASSGQRTSRDRN